MNAWLFLGVRPVRIPRQVQQRHRERVRGFGGFADERGRLDHTVPEQAA